MPNDPTIRIWCENFVTSNGDGDGALPLSALTLDSHIHGGLRIQLRGRLVPHLGYFGSDDVCLNTWLEEFWSAARVFESSTAGRHVFDEGEQGQPAFVFERNGEHAYFSIVDSEISDGMADPDWQRIEFSPEEFLAAHTRFREALFATIKAEAPEIAEGWIREHDIALK